MEEITFDTWRLIASIVDTDALKLEIEALDGTDIIGMPNPAQGGARDGSQYALRFTTQQIEDAHQEEERSQRSSRNAGVEEDEDETIYVRGWEVTALVDEGGKLEVLVEKGEGADIFEVEPLESGMPLASHVAIRLAAEETDEDEEDEEEEDELDEDYDDLDELDEADEYDDEYEEGEYEEEEEDYVRYNDLYDRDEDLY